MGRKKPLDNLNLSMLVFEVVKRHKQNPNQLYTVYDLKRIFNVDRSTMTRRLKVLLQNGIVEKTKGMKGSPEKYMLFSVQNKIIFDIIKYLISLSKKEYESFTLNEIKDNFNIVYNIYFGLTNEESILNKRDREKLLNDRMVYIDVLARKAIRILHETYTGFIKSVSD